MTTQVVRSRRRVFLLFMAVFVLLPVVALALTPPWSTRETVAAVVIVGTGALVTAFVPPRLKSIEDPDAVTRREVNRALRTGHTDDPRIDALARENAQSTLRQSRLLLIVPVVVLGTGLSTVTQIVDDDRQLPLTLLSVLGLLAATAGLVLLLTAHVKSRRYLNKDTA